MRNGIKSESNAKSKLFMAYFTYGFRSTQIFKAESKLWGGRFKSGLDPLMEDFNNSLKFDKRLFSADITGSIAYAKALQKCNLITGINF